MIPEYLIEQFKTDWLDNGIGRFRLMHKYNLTESEYTKLTDKLYNDSIEFFIRKKEVRFASGLVLPVLSSDRNLTIGDVKHVKNQRQFLEKFLRNA